MRIGAHFLPKEFGMSEDALDGWKEIATYLGVSVSKAQKLEREEGLPVLRLGEGERPRVSARCSEIDRWQTARAVRQAPASKPAARVRKRWVIAGVVCVLLLVAGAVWWTSPEPSQCIPSRVQRTANTISVSDEASRVCWTHTVPDVEEESYTDYETNPLSQRRGRLHWVTDLEADGEPEVLLVHLPQKAQEQTSVLYCFHADGTQRWAFAFGRAFTVGERFFANAYQGSIIGLARHGETRYLVAVAVHQPWFPTQVVLLDPQAGTLVDEYWHPGRFYATKIFDFEEDGKDELLLAGINNPGPGLGHGALAVLNIPFDKGNARTPDYFGNPGGKERAYRLFPRPRLFDAKKFLPAAFGIAAWPNGGFHIDIGGSNLLKIVYAFDEQLQLQGVHPSDSFRQHHAQLYADKKLTHPADQEEKDWQHALPFETAPDANSPEIQQLFQAARSNHAPKGSQ